MIKNWMPISLKIDPKPIYKVLAKWIEKNLPSLISSNCICGQKIYNQGRLIPDHFRNNGPFKDQRFAVDHRYRKSFGFCLSSIVN